MSFKTRVVLPFLAGLALTIAVFGCTQKQEGQSDPKRRLNEYISQGFAVKGVQDRTQLVSYLTGEAKTRLESWSDDQFRQAFIESKRQFVRLAFKELKSVSDSEVGITYELTYQTNYADLEKVSHDARVTNRRLAQMKRENGQWYIAEVRNIREVVEYKDEMQVSASKPSGR
jgi:hypothetical protein